MEIKSPKKDKNATDYYPNWFDKNKFKKILAITDSNKFSHKNKIDEFKYTGIKDLVNNIKNNTISEISAKKGLNTLNEIKNAEMIKKRRYTPKQKELLDFSMIYYFIRYFKLIKHQNQKVKKTKMKMKITKQQCHQIIMMMKQWIKTKKRKTKRLK